VIAMFESSLSSPLSGLLARLMLLSTGQGRHSLSRVIDTQPEKIMRKQFELTGRSARLSLDAAAIPFCRRPVTTRR